MVGAQKLTVVGTSLLGGLAVSGPAHVPEALGWSPLLT